MGIMIISSQGFGHFTSGINNQDFGIESEKMLLILDGCSAAKYSESGTRLFAQLFSRREEWDSLEKFEDNVKSVFDDLIGLLEKYYPVREQLEKDFIMENLLFTIIACFKTEESYVVKLFGDGYVVTQNKKGSISYLRFSYGKCPPYFAYKYCNLPGMGFSDYEFKTFTFSKEAFQKVIIATDGIMPIAKGDIKGIDLGFSTSNASLITMDIRDNRTNFNDDVTIGMFADKNGGKQNGIIQ